MVITITIHSTIVKCAIIIIMETKKVVDLQIGDKFIFAAGTVEVTSKFINNQRCQIKVKWDDGVEAWVNLPKTRKVEMV